MSRPRRAATQRALTKEDKASDNELDLSEESSDGDFSSASSDEWNPVKKKANEETFEESESDHESNVSESEEPESFMESIVSKRKSNGNRSVIATLRATTGNKFKRNQANRSSSNGSPNIQNLLDKLKFQKRKSIFEDSQNQSREKTPEFDCSGGLHLSASSDDSDDDGPSTSTKVFESGKKKTSGLTKNITQASGSATVDLKSIHDNLQQMEKDKIKLMNYKSAKPAVGSSQSQKENLNIADILAMGEGEPAPTPKKTQKRVKNTQVDDSDSDGWEEVEDEKAPKYKAPENVEIMLNELDEDGKKKVMKTVDLEAQLKRKLNRRRKEHQMFLHKVNLMSWVAHGNFINRKLNDTNLMKDALQLLPKNKNHCYPMDKTDLDYFKQITKWFKSTIELRNTNMYTDFKPRPPIMMSLALQMKFKKAISRRDYVLIFVTLLRAIGIQCRMVQSLVVAPILPPKSELLSLAIKKPEEKSKTASKSSSKASSSKRSKSKSSSRKSPEKSSRSSRSKSKKELPKIPQLDGVDDEPTTSEPRKTLKIKALPGFKDDESFVDITKEKNPKKLSVHLPKRTRSESRNEGSPTVTKLAPKVRFSMDSPNRGANSPSEKLFKSGKSSLKNSVKKVQEALKPFSPRKTRSKDKDAPPKPEATISKSTNPPALPEIIKKTNNAPKQDFLQVISPRRLRSRSRSTETQSAGASTSTKPNLKNLQKAQDKKRPSNYKGEVDAKKQKVEPVKAIAVKRSADVAKEVPTKKVKTSVSESISKPAKVATKQLSDDEDFDIDSGSDSSLKLFKNRAKKTANASTSKVIDRRVLSTDSEDENKVTSSPVKKSKGIDIWVEVYSEKDERWISIDVFKGKVDDVKEIAKTATHPLIYVFAWNNDNSVKDVSPRYCANLNTTVRKMRVDSKYLNTIMLHFEGRKTSRDVKEDDELNQLQFSKPMPTAISEFKNHPLYALKRHLLKYEAIYPPEPPILGYIREEAIYPRDCVFVLHTRETWLKEAKVVKLNEQPYKMSKTLKWDNVNRKLLKDIPQELFGVWQTKDYEPPVAENGMVPRNAYGNVELFKPCMLPIGTVHIQLPGLSKVCKKIGVDCSQAIVGFDSNGGWPFPVYDGFIVCKEFEDKVIDAWNREQEEVERKETEKYEKRVYGNWKKLIKGLYIRQRLKNKYNFEGSQ